MTLRKARILILCKTYPSPSAKRAETSCVAGVDSDGHLIRLYPVPFRLIKESSAQFKKWQWLTAIVEAAKDDRRPESHRIKVDTIVTEGEPLSTKNQWAARRETLEKLQVYGDFGTLESARQKTGVTIGLVRPARIVGLDVTPVKTPHWTDEERDNLLKLQQQGNLFDTSDATSISMLRKLPFDFHYRYECAQGANTLTYRHKIVDWEVGALFWNVHRRHGADWLPVFKKKLEEELPARDLMFLMGTIHRFPDQWLIISLIYPPMRPAGQPLQQQLL